MRRIEQEAAEYNRERSRYAAELSKSELRWKRKSESHARRMRVMERKGKRIERLFGLILAMAIAVWVLSGLVKVFK
jgi:hypothetical protein